MVPFYTSIIFIGIILIVSVLFLIGLNIKKSRDYEKRMDEKKAEMISIINDSELMIEELNKFSDYIVTQMKEKNSELSGVMRTIEEKIAEYKAEAEIMSSFKMAANGMNHSDTKKKRVSNQADKMSEMKKQEIINEKANKQDENKGDNVIVFNARHKEVLQLSMSGLNDIEIARTLNMGRGEVQLILGLNK